MRLSFLASALHHQEASTGPSGDLQHSNCFYSVDLLTTMTSYPVGFRVAQAVGITGAAWVSGECNKEWFSHLLFVADPGPGNIAALSMNTMPALLAACREYNVPVDLLVRQWSKIYEAGKTQNPPIAAVASAAFLYLAYSGRRPRLYATAAVLTLGIVPYTLVAMGSTNAALLAVAHAPERVSDSAAAADHAPLVRRWVLLNAIRSLLPLAGSLVGIAAVLF